MTTGWLVRACDRVAEFFTAIGDAVEERQGGKAQAEMKDAMRRELERTLRLSLSRHSAPSRPATPMIIILKEDSDDGQS